jgi:hypothetical protein
MNYWRWNPQLSTAELRERVVRDLLRRTTQQAAGPCCLILPELRQLERRQHPDRRLGSQARVSLVERRQQNERRRYGVMPEG